jgi:hypothetical protein
MSHGHSYLLEPSDFESKDRTLRFFQPYPRIQNIFEESADRFREAHHSESIRRLLQRLLKHEAFFSEIREEGVREECMEFLNARLPLIVCEEWSSSPFCLSVFLLCRLRPNVSGFFYDMIHRWLLPGKRLPISLFFAADFKLPDISNEAFLISEICLCIEDEFEIEQIRLNLPILLEEIRVGVSSYYQANRILEVKGLLSDDKTALIQKKIADLVQRRPDDFDYDIFGHLQHFLVMAKPEFKAAHESHHLSRMICIFYLFHRSLKTQMELIPEKRHLALKFKKAYLHLPLGTKRILGVFVGMSVLKENEVFEERHLLQALQLVIPEIEFVEHSLFMSRKADFNIHILYLEVQKRTEEEFSLAEIKKLNLELPELLKNGVERLIQPVFMPRNEEEVMRNILTLSNQLKFFHDIPQVIVSFDSQLDDELSFTVILLRILKETHIPLQELFSRQPTSIKFIPDRVKIMGFLRKKYPKEAAVFRILISSEPFKRKDHTLDLFKARQKVIVELQKILGEFRDFNGGMLAKQVEILNSLKKLFHELDDSKEFFLENFFHAIFPVEMRSILSPLKLKTFFTLFLTVVEDTREFAETFSFRHLEEESGLYMIAAYRNISQRIKFFEEIHYLQIPSNQWAFLDHHFGDRSYFGCLYQSNDKKQNAILLEHFKRAFYN